MLGLGFLGSFDATIDDKGRLRVPAKFRTLLGEKFVIAQGADSCLSVYPEETWQSITASVMQRSSLDLDAIEFRRTLFPTAMEGEFDSAGRVLVPVRHRNYAGLQKELVVVGNYDFFEIWDAETWQARNYESAEKRRDLQKKLNQAQ